MLLSTYPCDARNKFAQQVSQEKIVQNSALRDYPEHCLLITHEVSCSLENSRTSALPALPKQLHLLRHICYFLELIADVKIG